MPHTVKCAICGETFDRDKVQAVRHGARRYSHYDCEPNGELVPLPAIDKEKEQRAKDLSSLKDYIDKLFDGTCNWSQTSLLIKKYETEYGYTYTGMEKALKYFYEIKRNPISKAKGSIGILPHIYEEAKNYYLQIYLAQQEQQKNIDTYQSNSKVQNIKINVQPRKKKLFNL